MDINSTNKRNRRISEIMHRGDSNISWVDAAGIAEDEAVESGCSHYLESMYIFLKYLLPVVPVYFGLGADVVMIYTILLIIKMTLRDKRAKLMDGDC